MSLLDPALEKALELDAQFLKRTKIPIVTVSASFKEDLKGIHGFAEDEQLRDVVFSRAHYSMTVAVLLEAWGPHRVHKGTNKHHTELEPLNDFTHPDRAWVVDPTNFVSHQDWKKIRLTEIIGQTLARRSFLKKLKDLVDAFGRKKLPILASITPPLLHLFQEVTQPILSLHIAAGNILAQQGKTIVQVVTDPHVREEYLDHIENPKFTLCVFDEKTKTDVIEKSTLLGKTADPNRIIVTGPPIDARILAAREKKQPWRSGTLRLCLTTGGLGTNKSEIRQIVTQLVPYLPSVSTAKKQKKSNQHKLPPLQLMVYAGTQHDIAEMVTTLAEQAAVKITVLYHPQIVDANELLIQKGFPWADGFITKPSGDMAYDAAASGSFILTLKEWGVWEYNITQFFEQKGISRKAQVDTFVDQLSALANTSGKTQSWIEKAMNNTYALDKKTLRGAHNIITTVRELAQ